MLNFYKKKIIEILSDTSINKENIDREIITSIEKFTRENKEHLTKKERDF